MRHMVPVFQVRKVRMSDEKWLPEAEFLAMVLLPSGAGSFFIVRGCSVYYGMFSSISGLHLPPAVTTNNVTRHCQMSPGGQIYLLLKTTGLKPYVVKWQFENWLSTSQFSSLPFLWVSSHFQKSNQNRATTHSSLSFTPISVGGGGHVPLVAGSTA